MAGSVHQRGNLEVECHSLGQAKPVQTDQSIGDVVRKTYKGCKQAVLQRSWLTLADGRGVLEDQPGHRLILNIL